MWKESVSISALAIVLFADVSLAYCGNDPRVETVVLDSKGVTQIPLCAGYVTTVLFPRPVSGIVGYGLTNDPAAEEGWIQYAHPGDSELVTLRVLKPELRVAYMTVLVGAPSQAASRNEGRARSSANCPYGLMCPWNGGVNARRSSVVKLKDSVGIKPPKLAA